MPLNLAELKALAAAATPGPWLIADDDEHDSSREIQENNEYRSRIAGVAKWTRGGAERIAAAEANARFIAASRAAIPALVAEVEMKDARIAELEKALKPLAALADQWEAFWKDDARNGSGCATMVSIALLGEARAALGVQA